MLWQLVDNSIGIWLSLNCMGRVSHLFVLHQFFVQACQALKDRPVPFNWLLRLDLLDIRWESLGTIVSDSFTSKDKRVGGWGVERLEIHFWCLLLRCCLSIKWCCSWQMLQRRAFHSILLAREDHWLKYLSLLCPHLSRCDDGVFSRSKPCHSLGWTVAKRLTRDVLIQVLLRPEPIRVAAIEVGKVALRAARSDIAL